MFPWVGFSNHQIPFCCRGTCYGPNPRTLGVTEIQVSNGSGCFPYTSGEDSLFSPIPYYLNYLNPNTSPGHLTLVFTTDLLAC